MGKLWWYLVGHIKGTLLPIRELQECNFRLEGLIADAAECTREWKREESEREGSERGGREKVKGIN